MLTLKNLRDSNPTFATGGADLTAQINNVVERFLTEAIWKFSAQELDVNIYSFVDSFGHTRYQVTLPSRFETLLGAKINRATGQTSGRPIHNQWYRYNGPSCCEWGPMNSGVMDMGDGFQTFRDIPTDSFLRIKTDFAETGTLHIRGIGTDGQPIYTGISPNVIKGTTLNLATNPATTSMQFKANSQVEIIKPISEGPVELYSWDGTTETLLAIYSSTETNPCYRRYMCPSWAGNESITALAKVRHVPLVDDNDLVIPSNSNAITLGLKALRYEHLHDLDRAQVFWDKAYEVLNGQLRQHQGVQLPKFRISGPGFNFVQIQ